MLRWWSCLIRIGRDVNGSLVFWCFLWGAVRRRWGGEEAIEFGERFWVACRKLLVCNGDDRLGDPVHVGTGLGCES